jgi:hypothetical protein
VFHLLAGRVMVRGRVTYGRVFIPRVIPRRTESPDQRQIVTTWKPAGMSTQSAGSQHQAP